MNGVCRAKWGRSGTGFWLAPVAHWFVAGWCLASCVVAAEPSGAVQSAAELLPPTTVVFAEVSGIPRILDQVLEHPLRHKFDSLDQVKASYEKQEFLDFKAAVAVVESQMGLPWRKIVAATAGGGVAIGIDAQTEGLAVLVQAQDDTSQKRLLETLVELAKSDATNKGKPNPVKTGEHRGLKGYGLGKASMVVLGRWTVLTNKGDLLKWIIDCHLDRPAATLATNASFTAARGTWLPQRPLAWGWVDTAALRDAGVAKKLYSGRTDNPLAELLFGGIASTLQHTPYVTAALTAGAGEATLKFSSPLQRAWGGEARQYFFGPQGAGAAPPPLQLDNLLVSLQAYRDISQMWLRAGDLFDENTNEELAKADSNLSTLFGGKDFGEDILGSFDPEMQLIVARQEFAEGNPRPAIKIPAFALVFQLKDREKMQPELRRTFQSLIGFLNVIGAMNNQPQLDLDMEKREDVQLVTATYLLDEAQKNSAGLKLHYNFSPSVAFAGERIVISSTKELARRLATAVPAPSTGPGERPASESATVNTQLTIHFDQVRAALADNRGQLVAQNMLQEGNTKEEAEQAVEVFLELIGWLDQGAIRLTTSDQNLQLSLSVSLDDSPK